MLFKSSNYATVCVKCIFFFLQSMAHRDSKHTHTQTSTHRNAHGTDSLDLEGIQTSSLLGDGIKILQGHRCFITQSNPNIKQEMAHAILFSKRIHVLIEWGAIGILWHS